MNFPLSVDNKHKNNVLMYEGDAPYDWPRAAQQFMGLYRALSREALVYVLPSTDLTLQDLPYVANLGCYLPHIRRDFDNRDVMLLSNFKSEPRWGEAAVGRHFFRQLGYDVHQPVSHWEGEADLKWLRENIYIAGWGMRSDLSAFHWMAREFAMDLIEVRLDDPKNYHLDCSVFPLGPDKVLAAAGHREIERVAEVIAVPDEFKYHGWTNSVRLFDRVYHAPYSNRSACAFASLLARQGLELVLVQLDEFEKSGADLSCLVLRLNAVS